MLVIETIGRQVKQRVTTAYTQNYKYTFSPFI